MPRRFDKNFWTYKAVNSLALSECSLLMRSESVISNPSNERLSKNDVILSRAAQTSTDVLVLSNLVSINKGLSGSRRAPTKK